MYTSILRTSARVFQISIILLGIALSNAYAQCEQIDAVTASATPADCPSNGKIQVSTPSGNSNPGYLYQIVSGPSTGGFPTNTVSNSLFESLPPGEYSIRVTCGNLEKTIKATVDNQYTPLNLSVAVQNEVCLDGDAKAEIIATASGGKGQLLYAVRKSDSANESDNLYQYDTSPSFNVTGAGNYQVRVKDECNNYITYSTTVSPAMPRAKAPISYSNKVCGSNGATITAKFYLNDSQNGNFIEATNSGYRVEIYDVSDASECPANSDGLTLFQSHLIMDDSDLFFENIPITVTRGLIKTISPCGEVDFYCLDVADQSMQFQARVNVPCTPGSGTSSTVNIAIDAWNYGPPARLQVFGVGNSTALVDQNVNNTAEMTPLGEGLPYYPSYELRLTDQCGDSRTITVETPTAAGGNTASFSYSNLSCVSEAGKARVAIFVSGYAPGVSFDPLVELVDDNGNVVATASEYYQPGNTFLFNDVPAGIYSVRVSSNKSDPAAGCVTVLDQKVEVTMPDPPFAFELAAKKVELCGGNANIIAQLTSSGGSVSFELRDPSNSVLASNATGVFANMAPGVYTLAAVIDMSGCGKPNREKTVSVEVKAEDSFPKIIKVLGIICETSSNPSTSGKALFQFSGFGPFTVEVTKRGQTSMQTYENVPNNWTLNDLEPNATYDIRIIDQCGKTAVTEVTIKPLEAITVTNSARPCIEDPYTFGVEDMIDAQYSWTKNGADLGVSTREITINSYDKAANDGTYVCTVTLADGCIVRQVTITLDGKDCSMPVTLVKFNAVSESRTVKLFWETALEVNSSHFEIERSFDAKSWLKLGRVTVTGNNSKYSFPDELPLSGLNYYRLKIVDLDATFEYSQIVSVVTERQDLISLFPNPSTGTDVNIALKSQDNIRSFDLINANGTKIASYNSKKIQTKNLSPGVYFVKVYLDNGAVYFKKLVVSKQ